MGPCFFALLSLFVLSVDYVHDVNAHALMVSPKPRNLHAYESGLLGSFYEATALNNNIYQSSFRSESVCGQIQNGGPTGTDYDHYSSGIQAAYTSGQIITVDVEITVYHYGHFEFSICPAGSTGTPTQDCFRNNKLTIVKDNKHDAPLDPNYPERAMAPPQSFGIDYSYQVALPHDLASGSYVLKWMYVSANSCVPVGYHNYPFPSSWGPMYSSGLATCDVYDLAMPLAVPEIFINCAEVSILGIDTASEAPPQSTTDVQPGAPSVEISGFCGGGYVGNGICVDASCCSEWGYCGCSICHCTNGQSCGGGPWGENCGDGHAGNGICLDGSCCSEWGYCGCTVDHCVNGQICGGGPVTRETADPTFRSTPAPTSSPSSNNIGYPCCSNGLNGLTAANNCNGYVLCMNGVDYGYQPCAPGLKFQQANGGYCQWADNVQCHESCSIWE